MKTLNRTQIPYLKMMIYGYGGRGKSWMAAACPKVRTFYIYTEKQCETTIGILERAGLIHPESEFIHAEDSAQVWEALHYVESNVARFHLFVFDSIDDHEEMVSAELASVFGKKTTMALEDFSRNSRERDAEVQFLLAFIRNLPIHTVVIAHPLEREITVGKGKDAIKKNRMEMRFDGKKASDTTVQKFNAVGFFDAKKKAGETERTVMFRGPSNYLLKDLPYFDDVEPADLFALLSKHANFYRANPAQKDE